MGRVMINRLIKKRHIVSINWPLRREIKPLCVGRIINYSEAQAEDVINSITRSHRQTNCIECLEIARDRVFKNIEEIDVHITRLTQVTSMESK